MLHFLDSIYKLQSKRLATLEQSVGPQSELHNFTDSSPKCRVNFNRYTIQFPDFSNTSYHNLEHRLTIMLDNFSPLSNSTSVLLKV